ncbi:hypothetical protein GGH12_002824 [Coemansia sp. RSA 1822]|nr:hypothetical protein LPJ76_000879 [Coemansia sp. RSA 638]KAJ2123933.1 hypothetical protein IW147_002195 [Coemansia sp. RSA 720]KAJ2563038.1 hypothetical protein GGH12_002824 [Coemansia sp. RSA 1822]
MALAQQPENSSGGYATRDRIIVLSLAAEFGTENWEKIANFLAIHGQTALLRAEKYTQHECQDIYNDALRDIAESPSPGSQGSALSRALYRLKNQRMDEIQHGLQDISEKQRLIDAAEQSDREAAAATQSKKSEAQTVHKTTGSSLATLASKTTQPLLLATQEVPKQARIVAENTGSGSDLIADHTPETKVLPLAKVKDQTTESQIRQDNTTVDVTREQAPVKIVGADESRIENIEQEQHSPSSAASHSAEIEVEAASHSTESEPEAASHSAESEPEADAQLIDNTSNIPASKPKDNEESVIDANELTQDSKSAELAADEQQLRNWKKNINMVWNEISGHRYGSMFLGPIKSADAPHYYGVIRKPLDLKAIKNRIRDEDITTTVQFYRDIMHVFMNALMYNGEDTEVYQMTMEMLPDAQACIEQLLQTEAAVNQPKDGSASSTPADTAGAARGEDEPKHEEQEGEDSDASVPAKRKRRVASERASKHLRE